MAEARVGAEKRGRKWGRRWLMGVCDVSGHCGPLLGSWLQSKVVCPSSKKRDDVI